ncbi:MAG: hypothetical protein CMM15_09475 [Rhodospirillaceae bacterium]|nr:hypothetical protein [Rhodospirillaceae bacterium]|tara:strand:- start:2449 stop:2649 length:201 start_codon:yes stop_codon:yes gene_type:complete
MFKKKYFFFPFHKMAKPKKEMKPRKLNAYFTKMLAAREKGTKKFTYKGTVYVRTELKSGMITYKKK